MSWFCKFGGATTSGSAKTQNHRSRIAGHALTDQSKHYLTEVFIRSHYFQRMHQGVDALLTFIRNRFWIIGGRRLVRQVKRRCMRCKRHDSAPCSEVTAPLPAQRIQFERPFNSCGIDYAGPLSVRDGADVLRCGLPSLPALHQELVTWKWCEAYRLTIFSWLFVDLLHAEADQTISFG